jgi:hypothetical protein
MEAIPEIASSFGTIASYFERVLVREAQEDMRVWAEKCAREEAEIREELNKRAIAQFEGKEYFPKRVAKALLNIKTDAAFLRLVKAGKIKRYQGARNFEYSRKEVEALLKTKGGKEGEEQGA